MQKSRNDRKSRPDRMISAFVAVCMIALIGGCSGGEDDVTGANADPECGSGTLVGAGATFQQNAQRRWINDFTTRCHAITLSYESIGSGAGIERFIAGTVDYAGSDSIMTTDEQRAADLRCAADANGSGPIGRAIHLPVAGGAVVFLFNVPGLESLRLSPGTVAGLFQRKITMWDDPRIAEDNPDVALPATPVVPVRRGDSSGTTDVLSKYLTATAGEAWRLGTGKKLTWPEGVLAADGSDGVTRAVADHMGGITYAELSFGADSGLPSVALRNQQGRYLKANAVNVPAALAAADSVQPAGYAADGGDIRITMDFLTKDPAAYPASTVTYAIVCDYGNRHADLLRSYFTYVLTNGQEIASTIGYAPLPDHVATRARRAAVSLG